MTNVITKCSNYLRHKLIIKKKKTMHQSGDSGNYFKRVNRTHTKTEMYFKMVAIREKANGFYVAIYVCEFTFVQYLYAA